MSEIPDLDAMTVRQVKRVLEDRRFTGSEPLYVRVVQVGRADRDGSWHADEYPIMGGLTGWEDGHTTLAVEAPPAIDARHLERQRESSDRTFGPGSRTLGVTEHIRKELEEIEANPQDAKEWIDVVILALDGAWRAGLSPQQIINAVHEKQGINERRTWPDWREGSPDHAIEHVRSDDSQREMI
jgi:hypothetical protein